MKKELIYTGMVNSSTLMTIGCKYQVVDFREGLYILDDDNGLLITLSKGDFMSVEDWRNKRIDLLINE